MRVSFYLSFAVGFALFTSYAQDPPPQSVQETWDISKAQVTLPYSELRRLWEAATAEEDPKLKRKPPVEALVHKLNSTLTVEDSGIRFQATLDLESFTEEWHAVPLLGTNARLTESSPPTASLRFSENDLIEWLRSSPGPAQIVLDFVAPRQSSTRELLLELNPGPAMIQRLQIQGIPQGKLIELQRNLLRPTADGRIAANLAPSQEPVRIFLLPQALAPEAVAAASNWQLSMEALVDYQDGSLRHHFRIHAQDLSGPGQTLTLLLPAAARNVSFESAHLSPPRASGSEAGFQSYPLHWETSGSQDRLIELDFSLPVSPFAATWPLRLPQIEGQSGSGEVLFVLPLAEGLELTGPQLKASRESHRISKWLREALRAQDFVSVLAKQDLTVTPRWLPRRSTAQATIAQAQFRSQLEHNGQILTNASWTIDHESAQSWPFALPADCEILACTINGRTTQPITQEDTSLELFLPQGPKSKIALTYTHRIDALEEIEGSFRLALPQTSWFIHSLDWDLSIPEAYAVTALDGNLEIASRENGTAHTVSLSKRLCQNETPMIEIFYLRPTQ